MESVSMAGIPARPTAETSRAQSHESDSGEKSGTSASRSGDDQMLIFNMYSDVCNRLYLYVATGTPLNGSAERNRD